MDNDFLSEIQHRLTKQRVTFNDVTYLIQELRKERAKVIELQEEFQLNKEIQLEEDTYLY